MIKPEFLSSIEYSIKKADKIEIPCKDLDLDCLPDKIGKIPFGSYSVCYAYDSDQGACPFVPILISSKKKTL